jgi:uncharacterized damage-inducible protein DinB
MQPSDLFKHWEQVHEATLETVAGFSDAELDYEPFAGMMSIGDIARHIADAEEGWFRFVVTHELDAWPEDYDASHYPTVAAIQVLLRAVHARTRAFLETLDEEALVRRIEMPWGGEASLDWIIWHVLEHEIHHRGELSLILGLLGRQGLDV